MEKKKKQQRKGNGRVKEERRNDNAPKAIAFCGLYTCVALIVPPETIANGAPTSATLKKSIADRTASTPLTAWKFMGK